MSKPDKARFKEMRALALRVQADSDRLPALGRQLEPLVNASADRPLAELAGTTFTFLCDHIANLNKLLGMSADMGSQSTDRAAAMQADLEERKRWGLSGTN